MIVKILAKKAFNLDLTTKKVEYRAYKLKKRIKMKNILEVCLSPDYGGLELHMKDLTKFLFLVLISSSSFKNLCFNVF